MKKLTKLAMIGMSMSMLISGCREANAEEMNRDMRSFYEQLTPDAQQKFLELDTEHRKMAMQIVDEYCKAAHECKGHREQAVEEQYNNQMQERQKLNNRMKNN